MALLKCLCLVIALICVYAEAQFSFFQPQQYEFRNAPIIPTALNNNPDSRFLFTNIVFTYTASTTTVTSTFTTSTVCTTSTAALSTCVAAGRRRRRSFPGDNKSRSLFYAEDGKTFDIAETMFLPAVERSENHTSAIVEDPKIREERSISNSILPLMIQPGFNVPENFRSPRLFLTVGTSTVTATTTTSFTLRLVAICSSSTPFSTC